MSIIGDPIVVWGGFKSGDLQVPNQSGSLSYTGDAQSPTWYNFDEDQLTIGGVISGTNAGSYIATFTPKDGYRWADNTTDPKNSTWRIDKAAQTITGIPDDIIVDTEETYSLVWGGNGKLSVDVGDEVNVVIRDHRIIVSNVTAGETVMTLTVSEGDNYVSATKTVNVTCTAAQNDIIYAIPNQVSPITYNGNRQAPVWNGYDSTMMDISGDASGTNAGSYTTTFTPRDGYEWWDGTTSAKTATWTIDKAVQAVGVNPSVISASVGETRSATITRLGDGVITATSSSQSKATVSVSNSVVSISCVGDGSCTISIAVAESTNYLSGSASISVSIARIVLETISVVPTQSGSLRADGTTQSPTWENYNASQLTIGGTTSASAAGTYTTTFTPKSGYEWWDGSVSVKNATWTIQPEIQKDLNDYTWSEISAISRAGTGNVYFDIGDAKEIILNGKIGTLSLSNVHLCVFILDFNHTEDGTATSNIMWGGFKASLLQDAYDVCLVDQYYYEDRHDGGGVFNMNHHGSEQRPYNTNYGGWKGSQLRYDILGATSSSPRDYNGTPTIQNKGFDAVTQTITNPVRYTLMDVLPSSFRNVLRLRTHYVDNVGNANDSSSSVTSVVDAVSLLSEFEVYGYRTNANHGEQYKQTQMRYYADGNSVVRYDQSLSQTVRWWLCSPSYYNQSQFCVAVSDSGSSASDSCRSLGLAPVFMT